MDRRTIRSKKSKTRNAKPYDRPNQSILGRFASKFKGILNPSWIFNVSQWMGTSEEEPGCSTDPQEEESGEEDEETPPQSHGSKRPRLGPMDQVPPSILSEGTQTWLDTPSASIFSPSSRLTSTVTQNSLIENKADQVIINGDDHSENSEGSASTSGCSSLVSSHKERSNCLPIPNRRLVQSPFETFRSELSRRDVTSRKEELSADMSASRMSLWSGSGGFSPAAKLQRRSPAVGHTNQPGFNVSAFVGSSKMSQHSDRKVASPFYQGKTSFGGASSTRRMPISVAPYQVERQSRNQIKVRPKESEDSLEGMSSAAKRILMTLEKMSSPVTDAKKIPNTNKSPVDLSLYLMPPRLRSNVVSIPTITKGPPIANISTISKLTTLKICKSRFQNTSTESFTIPTDRKSTPACDTPQDSSPQPLWKEKYNEDKNRENFELTRNQISTFEDRHSAFEDKVFPNKAPGKMRTKLTQKRQPSVRQSYEEREFTPLPDVPLPISTLPTINITNPSATFEPKPNKAASETTKSGLEFEFSPPIEIQTFLPPILQSNFTTSNSNNPSSLDKPPFTFSNPTELETSVTLPDSVSTVNFTSQPTPSILNSITKSASTWQCSECWILNSNADSKCLACDTPKKGAATHGQFSNLANSSSSWTCSECWIQNAAKENKCLACETPKKAPTPSGLSNSTKSATTWLSSSSKSAAAWQCAECWIQNPATETKCLACETVKKGESAISVPKLTASSGFIGNLSKSSMWSCSSCWVQNSIKEDKCLACETPNPSKEKSSGQFLTGHLNPQLGISPAGFKYLTKTTDMSEASSFIKPPVASIETKKTVELLHTTQNGELKLSSGFPVSDWKCDTCLANNASDMLKCSACETLRPSKRSNSGLKDPESFKFNSPMQNSPITFKFGSFTIPVSTNVTTSASPFGNSSSTGASSLFSIASNPTTIITKSSDDPTPLNLSPEKTNSKLVSEFKFGSTKTASKEITKPDILYVDLEDNENTKVQPSTVFGSALNNPSENSTLSTSTAFKITPVVGNTSDTGVSSFFKPPSSTAKSLQEPKSTLTDLSTSDSKPTIDLFKFGSANKQSVGNAASNISLVDLVDNEVKPANIFGNAINKTDNEINVTSTIFKISPSIGNESFSLPTSTSTLSSTISPKENSTTTQQITLNSIPVSSQASKPKENPSGGFNFKTPTALGSSAFGGFSMPTSNSDSNKTLASEGKLFAKVLESNSDKRSDSPFNLGVSSSSNASPFTLTNPTVFKMGDKVDGVKPAESSWGKSEPIATTSSTANPLFSFGAVTTASSLQFPTNISKGLDVKPSISAPAFSVAPTTTSTFSFGSAATTTAQSSASTGGFSFFAGTTAPTSSVFTFGASSNAVPPAKAGGFPTAATTTSSVFGTSAPVSTSAFVFGATVKTEPVNSTATNFAFGSGTAPSSTPSTFSGFQTSQPAAPPTVFQFGSQPSNNTAAAPAFGAGSGGGFTFGAKSEAAPNQMAPVTSQAAVSGFGAPSMQQPVFGGATAPTFGKTEKSTGFNFGAAAASTPFMQFGNAEKKPIAPQFSFGTPQDSQNVTQFQPQPQFNISTPPSFNFGATSTQGGPFQFAAASTPEQPAGRKIRKAVRRVRN